MDMICHCLKLHNVLDWERATSYSLFFRFLGRGTQATTTTIVVHPYPQTS
jgi:hypothetical protein